MKFNKEENNKKTLNHNNDKKTNMINNLIYSGQRCD